MAQIPFQRGELTDRVRRFSGLVGPYSGVVDELVSPVILAADLDVPPYRLVGQRWYAHTNQAPDGSGHCYFRLTSGPGSSQVLTVTDFYWSLPGNTNVFSAAIALFREDFNIVAGQPLVVPEQTPRAANNVWHYAEGQFVGQSGTAPPPAGGFANVIQVSTDQQFVPVPGGPIVLEPGNALIWQFLNTNATTVYMNIAGQFYPGGVGGEV